MELSSLFGRQRQNRGGAVLEGQTAAPRRCALLAMERVWVRERPHWKVTWRVEMSHESFLSRLPGDA